MPAVDGIGGRLHGRRVEPGQWLHRRTRTGECRPAVLISCERGAVRIRVAGPRGERADTVGERQVEWYHEEPPPPAPRWSNPVRQLDPSQAKVSPTHAEWDLDTLRFQEWDASAWPAAAHRVPVSRDVRKPVPRSWGDITGRR
jgi:hypothetical protein